MHHFFPLKPDAPAILLKDDPQRRLAPSLSPDILIAFSNDPLHPYFGDFVASSPSATNHLRHGEAAQLKYTEKLRHYSKHHDFPSRVCYPLAFERSGYLHPAFDDFIDIFAGSTADTFCKVAGTPDQISANYIAFFRPKTPAIPADKR